MAAKSTKTGTPVKSWKSTRAGMLLQALALGALAGFGIWDGRVAGQTMLLDIVFGGFLYGMSIVIALKGGASTAGTDFIALYISNRIGRSTWDGILVFNICILCVFGAVFGWSYAAYSVIFQFISTRTIDSFYKRYKCVTVQITTRYPDDILDEYYRRYRHGVSMLDVVGGYSKKRFTLLSTVISAYEVRDVSSLVLAVDRRALIDVIPTEHFYGGFYRQPLK